MLSALALMAHAALPSDPDLARLLLRADVVVVGHVDLPTCRDACLGTVRVGEVVRGEVATPAMSVVSAPPDGGPLAAPRRVVAFLRRDPAGGGRWRLELTERRDVGLDPARAPEIRRVEILRAGDPRARAPFEADLAALRGHDQATWGPTPILDPARRVFQSLDLRGLRGEQVTALIGAPVRREERHGHSVWSYTFHDGEQGVMPQLWLDAGGVVFVDVLYGM
jgi:hypothetical protein